MAELFEQTGLIEVPSKLGEGKVFSTLAQAEGEKGQRRRRQPLQHLHVRPASLLLRSKALGVNKFPEQPSNATFGGKDLKTLYVTARASLYAVPMEMAEHRFSGGK